LLLGGQRIGDERYKRKQAAGYKSTGGEPCGRAGGKIGSGYEFKLKKLRNAFFHDRPFTFFLMKSLNYLVPYIVQHFVITFIAGHI